MSLTILRCKNYFIQINRYQSSKILCDLENRGIIKNYLPNNIKELLVNKFKNKQTFYAGFDPTYESLHIGNLLILMPLLHLLRVGHQVICLIGEATALIGDPSGRYTSREYLDKALAKRNSSNISSSINKVFSNHFKYFWKTKNTTSLPDPIIINNISWYQNVGLIPFLSDIGRNIKLKNLFRKSFIENRIDAINFAEFSYQVMQANDWLHLYDRYNCHFQLGGSDQIHNIEAGYTLIRNLRNESVCGIFTSLLVDKDGNKIGKTTGNTLYLDRNIQSSFDFYQTLLKLPDTELEKFFKYFTFYTLSEIENIMQKHFRKPELRYGQEKLAEYITLLIHGEAGLQTAKLGTKAVFKNDINSLGLLQSRDLEEIFGDKIKNMFMKGDMLIQLLMKLGCFTNQEIADLMITKGAVQINNEVITDPNSYMTEKHILPNNLTLIKIGKKRYFIVKWC